MTEIRKEVKTYKVKVFCDNCNTEELVFRQSVSNFRGSEYIHQCKKCEEVFIFEEKYPYIEHEEIDSEQ